MARQAALPRWSVAGSRPIFVNENGVRQALTQAGFLDQTSGVNTTITPSVGALVITRTAPTVTATGPHSVTPLVGSLGATGQPPTVTTTTRIFLQPSVGSVAITLQSPTVTLSQAPQNSRQTLVAGGRYPILANENSGHEANLFGVFLDETIISTRVIQPLVGSLSLTLSAPVVTTSSVYQPSAGSVATTALSFNFNVGGAVLTPSAGSMTATATAPDVTATANQAVTPNAGSLAITRSAPVVTVLPFAQPSAGTLAISATAPIVTATVNAYTTPSVGTLSVAQAGPPNVIVSGGSSSFSPDPGDLRIVGQAPDVSLSSGFQAAPDAGALAIIGEAPDVSQQSFDFEVTPDPAPDLVIAGEQPVVTLGEQHFAAPNAGSVGVVGSRPVVTVQNNLPVGPSETELIRALGGVTRIRAITGVSGIKPTTFSPTE